MIAVVMASPSRDDRNETAKKLLDYGFANYEILSASPKDPLEDMRVLGGTADTVRLSAGEQSIVLGKGQAAKLTEEILLPENISAPILAGDEVGKINFVLDGKIISSVPITAAENVEKIGYIGLFCRFVRKLLLVEM